MAFFDEKMAIGESEKSGNLVSIWSHATFRQGNFLGFAEFVLMLLLIVLLVVGVEIDSIMD